MSDAEEPAPADFGIGDHATVTVFVGPDETKFSIYRKLVCYWSPYFRSCLANNRFLEGETGEVRLSEDDPDAFRVVVNWVHKWKMDLSDDTGEIVYVKAWILADKLMIPSLKNCLMDLVCERHISRQVNCQFLSRMPWDDFRPGLAVWRHYIDAYAYHLQKNAQREEWNRVTMDNLVATEMDFLTSHGNFCAEITRAILGRTLNETAYKDPSVQPGCTYHDHKDGRKCDDKNLVQSKHGRGI